MKFLKIFLPVVVILILAVALFSQRHRWGLLEETLSSEGHEPSWLQAKPDQSRYPRLSKLADEASLATAATGPGQLSPACQNYWMEVAQSTPTAFLESYRRKGTAFKKTCADFEADIPFAPEVYRTCALTTDKRFQDKANCVSWFKLYRAAVIDKLTTSGSGDAALADGILINKFIGRMSAQGSLALEELRKMGMELQKRFPQNPSTYLLLASLEILPEKMDAKAGADAAEQGLMLKPDDQDLQMAWFYFKSQEEDFPYATFVEKHPEYPYGQYFRAAQLWQQQQKETATGILENLLKKYPTNEDFHQTQTLIQTGEAMEENPFTVHFDFSKENW